ncbi:MAG: hypothetical protein KC656_12135 [Myxococcales bacterium]|nr:hypothetical protein [Myxococcales bacterium]MCB9672928.1 hypothetical protein [Alphaproteobacteria bacterium]
MADTSSILRDTCRITLAGMLAVGVWAWVGGHGLPAGFFLAGGVILLDLLVLAATVGQLNRVLVGGGNGTLGVLVLQGRFVITLLAVAAIASVAGIHAVLAGVVLAFTALTLSAVVHAAADLNRPLEAS